MADVTDDKKKDNEVDFFFFAIIEQLDGSIDWQKVADKCGIVSKAAASKRFSRMKVKYEANNDKSNSPAKAGTPAGDGEDKKTAKKPAKKATSKKRKVEGTPDDTTEPTVKDEEE